ncbi:hypothetical protein SAY87_002928 [Trapa incisa]|uniref:Uncharacterized protein n=1 Tax=Trapa incisa TaxID=236973 RepID=A0AAN7KK33_9MYRT|nr:hypothetical protein SAY87_002928 [Trapa incisa]
MSSSPPLRPRRAEIPSPYPPFLSQCQAFKRRKSQTPTILIEHRKLSRSFVHAKEYRRRRREEKRDQDLREVSEWKLAVSVGRKFMK